jgi:ADP-ribose pyrophosphatase YjhB (NUDIX family)
VPVARFCSACGERLPGMPPITCAACGTQHWRNAKPCANAIVSDGDRVLLTLRALAPWRGMWCAPGGFSEVDEHPIATAEREVYEETGLPVRVTGFIGIWLSSYAPASSDEADWISVAYYHAKPSGEQGDHDPAEVAAVRWFAPDELPSELAPPEVLPAVLAAWAADVHAGRTASPLPDRPT